MTRDYYLGLCYDAVDVQANAVANYRPFMQIEAWEQELSVELGS